ncbi:MAG: MiaB/RimO family radical SAM methylthiotransferase [Oscillospiraceae bacterium]|nr:MiaB/RimO family radical SAM methylthiotransferase [Oscillospiraceae bacterium]
MELVKQKAIMQRIKEKNAALPSQPLAYVDTYGCQQNESDSEKLRGMLAEMGYASTTDEYAADVIVINTCAIRENAENRVYGNIGELIHTKKAKPSQIIVFCGCMAAMPEVRDKVEQIYRHVDLMFGPNELWRFPELLDARMSSPHARKLLAHMPISNEHLLRHAQSTAEQAPAHTHSNLEQPPAHAHSNLEHPLAHAQSTAEQSRIPPIIEGLPMKRDGTIKAWLPIMYGCDNFCSYCIVPYVRGRERSRKPSDVVSEARDLVEKGYKDITLLGQNVNSYGTGLSEETNFADIIRRINDISGEFLIRFMTSHPKDASPELFKAMAESEKAAKHIHLPFQAGNDRILKLMNRGYSQEQYLDKLAMARELMPDIVITSDVIVGFPGETDDEFEDTLRLIKKARFDAMFTFIYSKRPGTPAAELQDPATRDEKQSRFDKLLEIQNAISKEKHMQYIGKTIRVLVDEASGEGSFPVKARTNGGRLVHLPVEMAGSLGSFVNVGITDCNSWSLFGAEAEVEPPR